MFPITPMDWSMLALRGCVQGMAFQMKLAGAMAGIGMAQQRKALARLRQPLPIATMGVCGPAPVRAGRPAAVLRTVPANDGAAPGARAPQG